MMQKLLADRFQLKFHREKRELSVYRHPIAKGGVEAEARRQSDAQPDQQVQRPWNRADQNLYQRHHRQLRVGRAVLPRPPLSSTRPASTGRYDFPSATPTTRSTPPTPMRRPASSPPSGTTRAEVRTHQSSRRRLRNRPRQAALSKLEALHRNMQRQGWFGWLLTISLPPERAMT
jgi:uncharacterized protein (TIGR03435 family)